MQVCRYAGMQVGRLRACDRRARDRRARARRLEPKWLWSMSHFITFNLMMTFGLPTSRGLWCFQDQGGHLSHGLRYCWVKALPNQPYMTRNKYMLVYTGGVFLAKETLCLSLLYTLMFSFIGEKTLEMKPYPCFQNSEHVCVKPAVQWEIGYIYIYIYIYIYVYIYVCIYIYICIYVYACVYIYIYIAWQAVLQRSSVATAVLNTTSSQPAYEHAQGQLSAASCTPRICQIFVKCVKLLS